MAKRVNTRFLIVLTAVFACLIAAAVVAKYTVLRKDPRANEAAGDQHFKNGEYKQAIERYRFAIAGNKKPAPLLVKLGDVLNVMVADDPENLNNARAAWSQAMASDPNHEPALQRLLDSYWEESELYPSRNDLYPRIYETAKRLAELRPGDTKVLTKRDIAGVRPWLNELPIRKPEPEMIVAMKARVQRDPSDADLRYYLAKFWLKEAWEFRQRGPARDAENRMAQAAALFDEALKDPPKDPQANALLQLRGAQVYAELDRAEKIANEAGRRPQAQAAPQTQPAGSYAAKAEKALAAAMESAKSVPVDSQLYFDVNIQAVDWAARQRRMKDAEKVCEEMLAKRPDDPKVRLLYARLLTENPTPAKREKAIELLSREVKVAGLVGPQGYNATNLRIQTLMELISTKIEQAKSLAASLAAAPQAGDAAVMKPQEIKQKQDQLLADIRDDMKRLDSMVPGEAVSALRLKAQLLQLEGKPAEALGMFRRAVTLMEGATQERKDWDLINELAHAYLNAGQTGSAKQYLERIVAQYESHVPSRLLLANVLMTENKLEEAKAHMREAEKHLGKMAPDSPEFVRARAEFDRIGMALMRMTNDPRLEEQYTKLPEGTRAERLNKAAVARQIKKTDEAVRLTTLVAKEEPKDMGAFQALLNTLVGADRRQEALAAVETFLANNPDKAAMLTPVRDRLKAAVELADATPQQVYERRKQLIEAEPESAMRSMKLADLERDFNNLDKAEEILQKLHNDNPGDIAVVEQLFDLNLTQRKWERAKGYMDKLVAAKSDGADGLLHQFRFAMSKGDTAEGLRLGKALTLTRPDFDVSFVALGQAYQADHRHAEAVKQYEAARVRKPRNVDALRGLIECYYQQNRPDAVRQVLDEARVLFPSDGRFREMELRYQLEFGDPMAVVTEREQLQKERPEVAQTWIDLATAYRRAARSKGEADAAARDDLRAKARGVLQKGAAKWGGDGRFVTLLADLAMDGGDVAAGEKLLQDYAARGDQKDRFEPQLLLADYYARANRLDEAQKAFESALQKADALARAAGDKKDAAAAATAAAYDIRLNYSAFLAQNGKYDDALKVLDVAAEAARAGAGAAADRRLFVQRLNVLIVAGKRDLAEQALLDALGGKVAGAAGDTGLQMMLVRVNYDGGRYDQALERVNTILKAEPDNMEAKFYRGQIMLRKPQPDLPNAINDLTEVRQADPRNAATRILLADAFRQTGDTPKAIRELEEGLRHDPLSREMRLRLMDYRSAEGSQDLNEVLRLASEARLHPQLKNDAVWAYRESVVYSNRKEWPRALAAIEDSMKLAPKDMTLVREYQSVELLAGNHKQVLDQTDRLVKENKAPWWMFMNRAVARNGLKDEAGAMNEFNLALTAAGGDNSAAEQIVKQMTTTVGKDRAIEQVMARANQDVRWKLLAAALHSVYKDWDNATKMLDDVQAQFNTLTPRQQIQALRISGPLYQLARPPKLEKARDAYEKLLKIAPNDLFALNNLATLLVDDALVSQPQEAKVYSKKAYDQVKRSQPFPAAILDTHGWVLIQCGGRDIDEGIDILQKVVRQTSLPEAHYHLAEGYLKKKTPEKALTELKVAADSINRVSVQGIAVSPDLEQKIRQATERANEMLRSQSGAAVAQ